MGWFKNVTKNIALRMLKYSVPEGWMPLDSATYSSRGIREIGPNPRTFMDEYKRAIWTYIAVKAKAESIAGMPWLLKRQRKGEDEVVAEHEFVDFVERPAPKLTWDEFCFETIADLELMGNNFNEKVKQDINKETYPHALALARMDPSKIRYEIEDDPKKLLNAIKKYLYVPGVESAKEEYEPDEILHIKYFDPTTPNAGLSPVQPAWDTNMLIRRALRFNIGFFRNGGEPAIALMTEAKLDAPTRERMAAEWIARHANESGQSGGVAVLSHGIKAQPFGQTHRDMQFAVLKENAVQEVLAAHRVPPVLVGMDTSSYASAATQMKVFREEVGQPLLKKILDKLTIEVLAEFEGSEGFYLEPDYRKMEDPADAQQRKTFAVQMTQLGAMDLNELREQFGMPRKPELDKPEMNPLPPGSEAAQEAKPKPELPPQFGGGGEKEVKEKEKEDVEPAPKPGQKGSLPARKSLVDEIRMIGTGAIRVGENGSSRLIKTSEVVSFEEAKEVVQALLKDTDCEFRTTKKVPYSAEAKRAIREEKKWLKEAEKARKDEERIKRELDETKRKLAELKEQEQKDEDDDLGEEGLERFDEEKEREERAERLERQREEREKILEEQEKEDEKKYQEALKRERAAAGKVLGRQAKEKAKSAAAKLPEKKQSLFMKEMNALIGLLARGIEEGIKETAAGIKKILDSEGVNSGWVYGIVNAAHKQLSKAALSGILEGWNAA